MISLYQVERVARQQASARTNKTGVAHYAEESTDGWLVGTKAELDEAFGRGKEVQSSEERVTALLTFAGQDDRYVKVRVGEKVFSIAKSRAEYVVDGNEIVLTISRRYAASRPELGFKTYPNY